MFKSVLGKIAVVALIISSLLVIERRFMRQAVGEGLILSPKVNLLGKILQTKPVNAEFELMNNSKTPITISRIYTSCGCTSASTQKEEIRPGESTSMTAKVDPSSRVGEMGVYIYVDWTAKNGEVGTLKTAVKAEVVVDAIIEPAFVDFGRISVKSAIQSKEIKVSRGNSDFDWDEVEIHAPPNISVISKSKDQRRFLIELDPSRQPCGSFRADITVSLKKSGDKASATSVDVPILGDIKSDLIISPKAFLFTGIEESTVKNAVLHISAATDQTDHSEIQSVEIECTQSDLIRVGDQRNINGALEIPFEFFPARMKSKMIKADLLIKITNQQKAITEYRLPILASIKSNNQ